MNWQVFVIKAVAKNYMYIELGMMQVSKCYEILDKCQFI